jgi:two-component system nitrogen regulation sensor histidine kinase NtrY
VTQHSAEETLKHAEAVRRKRELTAVTVAGALLLLFALAETLLPPFTSHTSLLSNIVVILLFDLSFVLLGLLVFLVGRNLAKVIFEHRRGMMGSRLQGRLVAGFIAAALFPTLFLLYVAESFLRSNINAWFDPEYQKVLDDSLEIAKSYYLNSANLAVHYARELAMQVGERGLMEPAQRGSLKHFVERKQREYSLGTIEVFSADRRLLVLELGAHIPASIGVAPESRFLLNILNGQALSQTEHLGKSDVIRGGAPVYAKAEGDATVGAVVVDYYLPRSLVKRANSVSRSFDDYLQLRTLKRPIFRSYILVLVLIALVVALLASWLGIYLARGITGPIKLLAEGTQAVAGGNLNYQIMPVGDDEIAHLVRSFNQMTADLRASRAELERRRRAIETLLHKVPAGVVAIDVAGHLLTINPCAERLLGVTAAHALGRRYGEVLPAQVAKVLAEQYSDVAALRDFRCSIALGQNPEEPELMMTATPLEQEDGAVAGHLLFFEDVSQIAKVERMEAWREVARRIAHEIKNPLTPIRLCAERIRRHLNGAARADTMQLIDECSRTILSEVEDLKHLVGEFSAFARMPQLNPTPGDLNLVAEEVANNFRKAHPEIKFSSDLEPGLPTILLDREAIKRALVNLLENAVAATGGQAVAPCIELRTHLNARSGIVTLEVADNGPGIKPHLKTRIFEPYFSTKQDGAGLGLAIVSAIVSDHHGFVRVRDNTPGGSRFVLEFPVKEQRLAQAIG